jgi:hypothetical protein
MATAALMAPVGLVVLGSGRRAGKADGGGLVGVAVVGDALDLGRHSFSISRLRNSIETWV